MVVFDFRRSLQRLAGGFEECLQLVERREICNLNQRNNDGEYGVFLGFFSGKCDLNRGVQLTTLQGGRHSRTNSSTWG